MHIYFIYNHNMFPQEPVKTFHNFWANNTHSIEHFSFANVSVEAGPVYSQVAINSIT